MRILITGIHGFVGSNLVKALSGEHVIYGLDIVAPEKAGVVKTFSWDNLEKWVSGFKFQVSSDGIPEVDAIIHLTGKAHDVKTGGKGQWDEYMTVNCGLTKKIFDYFLKSKARKFIFFSSVKAAADRVEGEYVDENVVPKPKGPYGESKMAAERYILSQFKEFNSSKVQEFENLRIDTTSKNSKVSELSTDSQPSILNSQLQTKSVYILRPCMIHGPGNKGNLNLLYNVVKKGIPWPLGAFENQRTFTSIDNLCFIINGLLTKVVASGIYNINDDEAVSTNELIGIICSATGRQAHIWNISRGLMERVARIGGWLHLPLNVERLQKLTENYFSANAKIKKALSVDRLPVRARDGLAKTIKSFENH